MLRTERATGKGSARDLPSPLDPRMHSPRMTAALAMAVPDGPARPATRRPEVDAVRGLVMIVMALDHVRDFLGNAHFDATDLAQTTAPTS